MYPDQIRDLPDKPWQHHAPQPVWKPSGAQTARVATGAQQTQHLQRTQQQQQEPLTERGTSSRGGSRPASSQLLAPLQQAAPGGVTLGRQSNNPQAHLHHSLPPSQPRRYHDGTFSRQTSGYCETYRAPSDYSRELGTALHLPVGPETSRVTSDLVPQLLVPGSRPPPRARGTKDAREALPPCRPEQQSFRLWSRVNTSHCVVPYETESQRAFAADSLDDADPIDRTHFMRVERKQYMEALQFAKRQNLIRGDRK